MIASKLLTVFTHFTVGQVFPGFACPTPFLNNKARALFIEFLFIINFFLSRQDHGKRVGTHTPGSFSHVTNQYNLHVTIYNIVLYIYI